MAAPLHTWHPLTMQTVSNMHLSYISNLALLLPYVPGCNLMIMVTLFYPVGLTENCRGCATQSLQYLKDLKTKTTLQRADPASIRIVVQKILHLGQVRYTQYLWILCPFRTLCCLWIQRLYDFQCVILRCWEFCRHTGVWFLPIFGLIVVFLFVINRSSGQKAWTFVRKNWEIWWIKKWLQPRQLSRRLSAELMLVPWINDTVIIVTISSSRELWYLLLYLGNDESGAKRYNRNKTGGEWKVCAFSFLHLKLGTCLYPVSVFTIFILITPERSRHRSYHPTIGVCKWLIAQCILYNVFSGFSTAAQTWWR